eukprot:TRINITY_DN3226_c0_g2_i3.p1 TRINITY_DN3226_c0_g2~~TRINITY_DN3226_c0_g2_i3.p1  ORF type:complete len:173 (+),score=27.07 TRINITY_DN3226_c0_g2_i3:84-602(+)
MDGATVYSGKKVTLLPEGGEQIEVPREVVDMAQSLVNMLKDLGFDDDAPAVVPVHVKPEILEKVLEYCKYHIEHPAPKDADDKKSLELSDFDKKFCEELPQKTLFDVILAANFLDIKTLLDSACLFIALKLKSMTPEEIRREYNITKEFTPEEEERARKEFEEMILQVTTKK